jgi:hypothetical protein
MTGAVTTKRGKSRNVVLYFKSFLALFKGDQCAFPGPASLETCADDHVSIEFRFWAQLRTVISIFLSRFKVKWHILCRRLANVEIKVRLFVAFGMLLPPQH